jgi:hypothetical protein
MDGNALDKLNQTFSRYVKVPTQQEQDSLMVAAADYREKWIETKANQGSNSKTRISNSDAPTRYKRIISVQGEQPDGTKLTLALQSRTSARLGRTWYVVSWRSLLSPGGKNRRFYVSSGKAWSMSASLALDMLEKLEGKGGLDEKYFDLRNPGFDARATEDSALLEEITMPEESWDEDPFIVVLNDPNADWRKILIVNRKTRQAAFRSTTKNVDYMPRKELRPGSEWYLDNSMQDVNVQQARVFLETLRKIIPTLA